MKNVRLDQVLLRAIFRDTARSHSPLQANWDHGVFKVTFTNTTTEYSRVVRLERAKACRQFEIISSMQKIASLMIPDLVPETKHTGTAINEDGEPFEFYVTDFVEGHTLEEVWEEMKPEARNSVISALIGALRKLHSIRLSDEWVRDIIPQHLTADTILGGPSLGFLSNGRLLLDAIARKLELDEAFRTEEAETTVVVHPHYDTLDPVSVDIHVMDDWKKQAVFCHNDLNPGNIILQADGPDSYKLAAIIDWELAGFYPASYELGLQDTYLSGANRLLSYYMALKMQMKDIVPRGASHEVLLQAMTIMFESRQMKLVERDNIPAVIRQRFIHQAGLKLSEDRYLGWTGAELSLAEAKMIEDSVVAERHARESAEKQDGPCNLRRNCE